MPTKTYLLILFILMSAAHAQEKSAFEQSLAQDTSVSSEESWMLIKKVRYRKYEWSGGTYYVKFKSPEAPTAEVYCKPPQDAKTERLVIAQPQTLRRSRAFVQAFHEACAHVGKDGVGTLTLNAKEGLTFPEDKKD